MHIPDNYLSPATCAVTAVIAAPVLLFSIKKVQSELPREKIPLLGVAAAFSFLFMMFNVPLPGGTTGHAVGGTLIAILLGPWSAVLSVSVALVIQAFLFGDGGILALGANILNMAIVLPLTGYAVYRVIRAFLRPWGENKAGLVGAALGSYLALNLAALFAAIEFGVQPLLFHGADGTPLYCPYPLSISIPAMLIPHATVAGLVELFFTLSVLSFIRRVAPDVEESVLPSSGTAPGTAPRLGKVYALLVILIVATPLGLLASGTAWGEWGTDEIAHVTVSGSQPLGFVPPGMQHGFSFESPFPDYSVPGLGDVFGYVLSAVAGAATLIILFKLLSAFGDRTKKV